jgi:hypothetical protein
MVNERFPRKLRNRELTGKQLQYAPDLSTNPKLMISFTALVFRL